MLPLKHLYENYELARECLKLYTHAEETLDEWLPRFRISSNAIYPFETEPGRQAFLRLSPAEEKSYEAVTSEIRLIEWLIGRGYPAMKPVAMKDGRTSAQVDTKWGRYNVSCFERVPGVTLERAEGSVEMCRGYGRLLGRLHRLMTEYPYAYERQSCEKFLKEIAGRLKKYGAKERVLFEMERVREEMERLPVRNEDCGIVHYDFEPDNVIYDKAAGAFGVIDFDDAIQCRYALDVVRAIDAMDDVVDERSVAEGTEAFLAGYREEKEFTAEQEKTLALMRRLVRIQSYATILRVLSDPPEDKPDWMIAIIEKLEGVLRRTDRELEEEND